MELTQCVVHHTKNVAGVSIKCQTQRCNSSIDNNNKQQQTAATKTSDMAI